MNMNMNMNMNMIQVGHFRRQNATLRCAITVLKRHGMTSSDDESAVPASRSDVRLRCDAADQQRVQLLTQLRDQLLVSRTPPL